MASDSDWKSYYKEEPWIALADSPRFLEGCRDPRYTVLGQMSKYIRFQKVGNSLEIPRSWWAKLAWGLFSGL